MPLRPKPGFAFGRALAWGVSTGAGIGFIPRVPGAAGSLLGLGLYGWAPVLHPLPYLAAVLGSFFIGVVLTGWAEEFSGNPDDPRIILDEVVGMWIALYDLPRTWPYLLFSFLLFRAFDIWKPFGEPGQRGLGIMVDDLMAGVCANIGVQLGDWLGGALRG